MILTDDKPSIECERCNKWFCLPCSSLSSEEFKVFDRISVAHWYCHTCEVKALEAVRTDQIVEERCKKFLGETMKRLDSLEAMGNRWERVEKLCTQLDTDMKDLKKSLHEDIVTKQNEPKEIITSTVQSLFSEVMEEQQEKEKRKGNIIIQGMTEYRSDDPSERLYHDNANVRAVLEYLEVTYEVKRLRRLGQRSSDADADQDKPRPRPLLVEFHSIQSTTDAKKKARNLRKGPGDFKNLYIQADMTKKERAKRRELVEELRRRQSNGEKNWFIRDDRLVKWRDNMPSSTKDNSPGGSQPFRNKYSGKVFLTKCT